MAVGETLREIVRGALSPPPHSTRPRRLRTKLLCLELSLVFVRVEALVQPGCISTLALQVVLKRATAPCLDLQGIIFFSGDQAIYHFWTWLFRMKQEAKRVGRSKPRGSPPVKSKKDKKSPKKRGRATRSGRGSSRGSQPSRKSSSSSGGDEPAPAPAPAPAAASSDAESSDEELPDGFKKEYHPEGMRAEREREAEVIRRERLSAKRRRKADKVSLPAVPEDPVPPQRGGFPTDDWPEDGFPPWFTDQCQKFGHDLGDEANVDALERMVAIFRAVDVRPYVPGRYISCDGYIENLAVLAQHVDKEKADALKKAIKDLRKVDRECRETDREKKPPKGACQLCAVVGTLLCGNQPVVRDHPRHRADPVTRSTSRRWRHSNSD